MRRAAVIPAAGGGEPRSGPQRRGARQGLNASLKPVDTDLSDAAWAKVRPACPATPLLTEDRLLKAITSLNAFSERKYDPALAKAARVDSCARAVVGN